MLLGNAGSAFPSSWHQVSCCCRPWLLENLSGGLRILVQLMQEWRWRPLWSLVQSLEVQMLQLQTQMWCEQHKKGWYTDLKHKHITAQKECVHIKSAVYIFIKKNCCPSLPYHIWWLNAPFQDLHCKSTWNLLQKHTRKHLRSCWFPFSSTNSH